MVFEYFAHKRACQAKQKEREDIIQSLPVEFQQPLEATEKEILSWPVDKTAAFVRDGTIDAVDVLTAYSKKALRAHRATNCLTEILIPQALEWARNSNAKGPLAGVPVSLKDTAGIAGVDSCIGYSAWVGKPVKKDSALVRLLKDAGAIPFVKTNVPITLLSFESTNDVFGKTENPHVKGYSPGGSTGGEAALLAYGGSRIGIGTDVAGSVRCPAHYSGVYTIKASMHRFPKTGNGTSIPGQIGIPAVYSPMTRTLGDLETFWRAIVSMEPWKYDHSCVPIPWREGTLPTNRPLKWGVMWDDGVVIPSPACRRALETVVEALKSSGDTVVDINPPSPYEALKIASQLVFADAGKVVISPIRFGEWNDRGVVEALRMFRAPRFFKKIYAWYFRYIKRDEIYAGLIENWSEKTVEEYFSLIAQREGYREKWFDFWNEGEFDFVLTVPNALPAVPHDGMREGFKACGYTFLFNMLDYSAGVLPVTHVDKDKDALKSFKPRNAIEVGVFKSYDAQKMHGLPVGVQISGRRLEEEKVLEGMKKIEKVLDEKKLKYQLLEIDD
ncbi:amidase signature enzyme [Abortiporus biennis]|nr:amidase signature enzyme [Abortiporus biennis]